MTIKLFFTACTCALLTIGCTQPKADGVVILHTNDTHSQVEPIAEGAKNGGMGGYARRMAIVAQERAKEKMPTLLVDAGDFVQGTPYFNLYHGRIEVDAMNRLGYDAATLGNHEFDYGVDTLACILRQANFPIVCCNYDVNGTALKGIVKPYSIVEKEGLRIGILGVGVQPKGLIADNNFRGITYKDPIVSANAIAQQLKCDEKCDMVICLSHIGDSYDDERPSDVRLAAQSQYIDAIIGGHTHEMVQKKVANLLGDSIPVVQMGKSGAYLGKLTLTQK